MKRIIEGVTYDTETATEVFSEDSGKWSAWWRLYQTRHGAFFKVLCDHDGETYRFTPLDDTEAQSLLEKHANHLVEQYFGPEYGTDEKRLTLRISPGLFRGVERAASAQNLNVNTYVKRCLEKAVTGAS